MANNEPKKRSIIGNLTPNKMTEREDDFTFNTIYVANRTIKDLCRLAAANKSKFSATELESAYNDLYAQAKEELYSCFYRRIRFQQQFIERRRALYRPRSQV